MKGKGRFIIVYALMAATGALMFMLSDLKSPQARPFTEFPVAHEGWRMYSQSSFSKGVLDLLRPTDYLARTYLDAEGRRVDVYIGYHDGGKGTGEIHSPKQCLPGGGWSRLSEERITLDASGRTVHLVKAVYQKGDTKEYFLYWYQVKGRPLSDEYSLKFSQVWNSIFHRSREAAFIRVSVPFDADGERAFGSGLAFIKAFYPVIEDLLPK